MRIRSILAAAAAPAALAAVLLGTAAAPAAHAATLTSASVSASQPGGNGVQGKFTGNGAKTYDDGWYFGNVKYNETQHPKFDTVSGTFLSGLPAWATPGQSYDVQWQSDFGTGQVGNLHFTINLDGSGFTGQATYTS